MKTLFKNKYKQGYDDGHAKGWTEGFEVGRKKAVAEYRKVLINRIEKDIKENNYGKAVIIALQYAITLIKRMK
jgi:flagellar biosynthesis/type III secretory pathway protein FliH